VAHGEYVDFIFPADLQDGLARIGFYFFIIYDNRYRIHKTSLSRSG